MSRVRVMSTDGFVLGTVSTSNVPAGHRLVFPIMIEAFACRPVERNIKVSCDVHTIEMRIDILRSNGGWNTEMFLVFDDMSRIEDLMKIRGFEPAERVVHWNGYGGTRRVWSPEHGGKWEDRPRW